MNEKDLPELPQNAEFLRSVNSLYLRFLCPSRRAYINTAHFTRNKLEKWSAKRCMYVTFADDISEEDAVAIMAQWAWMGEME